MDKNKEKVVKMFDCPTCGKVVQMVSKYYHMKSKQHQMCKEFVNGFSVLEQFQIDNMVSLKCI
jgi:predicted RNA-binding Zn-ribbon protein involved in translation (DUF1610 family)